MNRISIIPLFLIALLSVPALSLPALGQDIILLNQDGEKVGVAKDIDAKDRDVKSTKDSDAEKGSAKLENGVITVVGPDGAVKQFNLSEARSFTVTRSSKTVVDENGNRKNESVNKAILIGPDGVRREINLGNNGAGGLTSETKMPKTWMIGASCEPASRVLRAQLRLEEDMGLVVTRILRGSSAAQAGMQVNDVLMFADQKPIGTSKQLSKIVNEAGAAGNEVSFTVLRGGDEISVSVTPTEREGVDEMMNQLGPGIGGLGMDFPGFGGGMDFEFKQFGPGIIIGNEGNGIFGSGDDLNRDLMSDFDKKIQRIQEQMREMQRRMRENR